DDATAERAFQRVRAGMQDAELPYDVANISLDLAAVWLRQGRISELRQLVNEMVAIFRNNGIRREAIGALLMFKEALQKDQATEVLLRTVTTEIWRLERFPGSTGQPAG